MSVSWQHIACWVRLSKQEVLLQSHSAGVCLIAALLASHSAMLLNVISCDAGGLIESNT